MDGLVFIILTLLFVCNCITNIILKGAERDNEVEF